MVPRPISLVTTLDENGPSTPRLSASSTSSPKILRSLCSVSSTGPITRPKDTKRNIHRGGEFVVHMVDEALAAAMNDCAVDFPSGDSEVDRDGLATLPSIDVAVPRLAAAPFALECRRHVALAFGPARELLVGDVLRLHAREGLIDEAKMYVDFDVYRPIGRLFGNLYAIQRDPFAMARESHAQWLARVKGGNGASDENQ